MKKIFAVVFLLFVTLVLKAQNNDLQLARQYAMNGENQKAVDIYQKLYKQNNEDFYRFYFSSLLKLKKFDEAESITKKMLHTHPHDLQYMISLGRIYHDKGNQDKADAVYNDLLKSMPADENTIRDVGMQFYQAENTDYAVKAFMQGRKILNNPHVFSNEIISLDNYKHDKFGMVNEYLNLLQVSPEYLNQAKSNISVHFEGDQDYEVLKTALLKLIQQYPDQTVYADLLTWQYLQQKQYSMALNQALALSRRQNDGGANVFELCQTLVNNMAYDEAIRGYEYLIGKGKEGQFYVTAKIELINAKNARITEEKYTQADLLSLEKDYQDLLTEFGRTSSTAFAVEKLALLEAFKLHKLNDAEKNLESGVAIPGIKPTLLAQCKLDLGDVYLLNNKPWDATLLYSQVEKGYPNTDIGQDAEYRNAKLAYYTGDFNWAKGQLDILKAATSQLIANDALNLSLLINDHTAFDSAGNALKMYARADLLIFKEDPEKAVITLDSIGKVYPASNLANDVLMAKARILIQKNEYQQALAPLMKIYNDSKQDIWADDAVFMIGDIYENHLSDKTKAQTWYQKIITDYPGSLYLNEARKRFRTLRGDLPTGS